MPRRRVFGESHDGEQRTPGDRTPESKEFSGLGSRKGGRYPAILLAFAIAALTPFAARIFFTGVRLPVW